MKKARSETRGAEPRRETREAPAKRKPAGSAPTQRQLRVAEEIRHVLADVGRRVSFLRGSTVEGDSYDDIVLAANLFSQHQTGALMVIEREIGLRTYIESGVAMDARLSYDLLATIFRPSAARRRSRATFGGSHSCRRWPLFR